MLEQIARQIHSGEDYFGERRDDLCPCLQNVDAGSEYAATNNATHCSGKLRMRPPLLTNATVMLAGVANETPANDNATALLGKVANEPPLPTTQPY